MSYLRRRFTLTRTPASVYAADYTGMRDQAVQGKY